MINLKNVDFQFIEQNLARRGFIFQGDKILLLQNNIKDINLQLEHLNALANKRVAIDKKQYKKLKEQAALKTKEYNDIIHHIPNLVHNTTPGGKGQEDNPVVREYTPEAAQNLKDYKLNTGIDIKAGVDMAGARFTTYKKEVAQLHRQLIYKAMNFYEDLGYENVYVPYLVKEEALFGTGQYPKFAQDMFTTENNGATLYLIPTGEVPLTNLVRDKTLNINEVEQKLMTHTPCFRKEVGAAGRDTNGIIRQHQFEKVELVRTCLPQEGLNNLNTMLVDIENFVKTLNLKYRIIELCAGDIGFAGHKAYDIELWFAHERAWREIASVTWCHDFQARRLNAKYVVEHKKKHYLHTLNGTGLAVGRVMAAILENT